MMAGFWFLLVLPILIGQWVGVVGLAGAKRNGAWWCMMLGTALATLGAIGSVVSMVLMTGAISSMSGGGSPVSGSGMMRYSMMMMGAGSVWTFGALLFVIGFAILGFQVRRLVERTADLENVVSAQQEQAERDAAARLG